MVLKHFYTPQSLLPGQNLPLDAALAHRLHRVLRLPDGAAIGLFNGHPNAQGQHELFAATLTNSRRGIATINHVALQKNAPPPLHLALCLPKKDALDAALRQATELGATSITPLLSRHAVADKLNIERALQRLTEAAEQCERLSLPVLHPVQPLSAWLSQLKDPVAWAFERHQGHGFLQSAANTLLVGPEGGFSAQEVEQLAQHPHVQAYPLGQNILRVDTAIVAGLTLLRNG